MSFKVEIDALLVEAVAVVDKIEGVGGDEVGRLRDALAHARATLSTIPGPVVPEPTPEPVPDSTADVTEPVVEVPEPMAVPAEPVVTEPQDATPVEGE